MTGREFKDLVFDQFAKIAGAFSSPKRLELIDVLAQGEREVGSLSQQVGMTVANTSRHLQILKSARLVKTRREGVRIFYRLADDGVVRWWHDLQDLGEKRVAEITEIVRRFLEQGDTLKPTSMEELWERIQTRQVTVIDVRPPEEYRQGHIPGAISVPLTEIRSRLDSIPRDRQAVAYCRGPYCVLSLQAIQILRGAGFKVTRMREGIPEWKQAGFPVET